MMYTPWDVSIRLSCALVGILIACRGAPQQVRGGARGGVTLPSDAVLERVPIGDVAGVASNTIETTIRNPYQGNDAAIRAGQDLFARMNCVGCHGYDAKGGMGPDLTDTYWRYGGAPADIYNSIFQGRPQGMPAWGFALPRDDLWKIVAYIQALGGTFPAPLAVAGRQGNRGNLDTGAAATIKGRQDEE
jgi:cytochrome c oxidase cbb3-type subunit 3